MQAQRLVLPASVVVLLLVGVVAYAVLTGGSDPATADELGETAEEQVGHILEELGDGGTFTLEMETYERDRFFPDRVPEALHFPDRTREQITWTLDAEGDTVDRSTRIYDTDGELLATVERTEEGLVQTAPTGESFTLPAPGDGTETGSFVAWLEGTFAHAAWLDDRHGYEVTEASTLHGRDSTVLERSGVTDRREYEVVEDEPLLFRAAIYEMEDGDEVLCREQVVFDYEVTPGGE